MSYIRNFAKMFQTLRYSYKRRDLYCVTLIVRLSTYTNKSVYSCVVCASLNSSLFSFFFHLAISEFFDFLKLYRNYWLCVVIYVVFMKM